MQNLSFALDEERFNIWDRRVMEHFILYLFYQQCLMG